MLRQYPRHRLFFPLLALLPALAAAHPGGLDQNGCHQNRETGEFHCHRNIDTDRHGTAETLGARRARVARVVDGDTIVLESGEKVIGVDTPETKDPRKPVQRFGREATEFTKRTVSGKHVRLEFDQVNAVRGHRDRFDRLLAYVSTFRTAGC